MRQPNGSLIETFCGDTTHTGTGDHKVEYVCFLSKYHFRLRGTQHRGTIGHKHERLIHYWGPGVANVPFAVLYQPS